MLPVRSAMARDNSRIACWPFVNEYKLLVYGLLLFAVMRFAPRGLAGLVTRRAGRVAT